MHILFIHQNFPAQFGHIAAWLIRQKGFRCTFLSAACTGNHRRHRDDSISAARRRH